MASEVSGLITKKGLDPDEVEWFDLALCRDTDYKQFFEDYERSQVIAKQVDEQCLACPVMKQCGIFAVTNGETGVWGGVYYTGGKKDSYKNQHKDKEVWDRIEAKLKYGEHI